GMVRESKAAAAIICVLPGRVRGIRYIDARTGDLLILLARNSAQRQVLVISDRRVLEAPFRRQPGCAGEGRARTFLPHALAGGGEREIIRDHDGCRGSGHQQRRYDGKRPDQVEESCTNRHWEKRRESDTGSGSKCKEHE